MVEFVSWFGVAVIALFALMGFTGVVATTVLTAYRALRGRPTSPRPAETLKPYAPVG
jgi:hypothetical protein